MLLPRRCHLLDHVLSGACILSLDSVQDATSVLEQCVVLDAHRVDDIAVVIWVAQEQIALVVWSDAIVVT